MPRGEGVGGPGWPLCSGRRGQEGIIRNGIAPYAGEVVVEASRPSARPGYVRSEAFQALLWIGPAFLYLAFFIVYPFLMSVYLSVSSARVGSVESHFVGGQNYARLFADPVFWQTVRNSFVFTFGSELIRLIIGLPLAFALNRSFKGKRVVQGLILIPFVIPIALSSLAWKWMFDSLYSVINWMLLQAHVIEYPWQWLGEPGLAMWSVIILNVWRGFPFSAVILLAGLTAVPPEVIEAAKIDGAGPLRRFHYVVVPIVRPILFVGLLYSIVFSFTDFSAVWLLTQGGPYNTTHVFGTYAYNIGINAGDIGMGAAITLFIFPFLALIVILMLRFLRRE
ncbi:MAG: carbohydrate ABC transporter permease [Candidatus Rokuibacteriota bacterium]